MKNVELYFLNTNKYSIDELVDIFHCDRNEIKQFDSMFVDTKKKEKIGSYLLKKKYIKEYKNEDNGKPISNNLFFNVSHSDGIVVLAITKDSPIGVDIEKVRNQYASLIEKVCSKEEEQYVNDSKTFFKIWTSKEAYLKMTGEGLVKDLFKVPSLIVKNSQILRFCSVFEEKVDEESYIVAISLEGSEEFKIVKKWL